MTMLDRIPCEIFSEIIKISNTKDVFRSGHFDEIIVPPIKATHVCRSWRTALLSNPTMWTYIVLKGGTKPRVDQFDQTLRRSGTCPLHVIIDLWANPIDPHPIIHDYYKLSVISQQMHRCRQLQMEVSPQLEPFVVHCLDKPAPILQKFYLSVYLDSDDSDHENVLLRFHETLFSGHAPNLEHLSLQIFDNLDNFRLSLFANLSSLHLSFSDVTFVEGEVLLDILQSSPHLRTLNMELYYGVDKPFVWTSSKRRITLPHLRDLSLQGEVTVDVANLVLGHLDLLMENVTFDIACEDFYHKMSDSTILLNFLSHRRFTFVSASNFLGCLKIIFLEEMDQGYTGSRFTTIASTLDSASVHGLPKFLRTSNALDITHMSLRTIPFDGIILRTILFSLENLLYLRVHHGDYDDHVLHCGESRFFGSYLKALLPLRPQRSTGNSKTRASRENSEYDSDEQQPESDIDSDIDAYQGQLFPCPSLRTLEVLLSDDDLYQVPLDEAHLPSLSRCSRIREQAGYPLKCIANCGGLLNLARDIEAWLRTHDSGLSIEVRLEQPNQTM